MKNYLFAAALIAAFSFNVQAVEDQMASYEAECQKYAKEDGVAAEDIESYVSQCVQDMAASQVGEGAVIEGEGKEGTSKE